MSNREEREAQAAISKKQRELDTIEQKAEAAQKALTEYLKKAKEANFERLQAESLEAVRSGVRNEAMERFKKGMSGEEAFAEPDPTGFEKMPWDED